MMELYALIIYNSWMWAFRPKNKTPYEEITNKSEAKKLRQKWDMVRCL